MAFKLNCTLSLSLSDSKLRTVSKQAGKKVVGSHRSSLSLSDSKLKTVSKQVGKEVVDSHSSSLFLSLRFQTQNGFKASWQRKSWTVTALLSFSLSDSKLKTISKQVGKEVVDSHHSFDSSRHLIVSARHKDDSYTRPIRFPCRPRFRETGKRPTPPTPQTPPTPLLPSFFAVAVSQSGHPGTPL